MAHITPGTRISFTMLVHFKPGFCLPSSHKNPWVALCSFGLFCYSLYTLMLPSPKFIRHLFPLLVFTKPLDLIGHGKLFLRWPVPFHLFNQSQAGLKTQPKFKGRPKDTAQHMVLATEVMPVISGVACPRLVLKLEYPSLALPNVLASLLARSTQQHCGLKTSCIWELPGRQVKISGSCS